METETKPKAVLSFKGFLAFALIIAGVIVGSKIVVAAYDYADREATRGWHYVVNKIVMTQLGGKVLSDNPKDQQFQNTTKEDLAAALVIQRYRAIDCENQLREIQNISKMNQTVLFGLRERKRARHKIIAPVSLS